MFLLQNDSGSFHDILDANSIGMALHNFLQFGRNVWHDFWTRRARLTFRSTNQKIRICLYLVQFCFCSLFTQQVNDVTQYGTNNLDWNIAGNINAVPSIQFPILALVMLSFWQSLDLLEAYFLLFLAVEWTFVHFPSWVYFFVSVKKSLLQLLSYLWLSIHVSVSISKSITQPIIFKMFLI